MMAACAAAENGNKVTLIEQNEKLGKKLFLTGKGRCNITNACPVEELFDNIVTNKKFLYSAFYGFTNSETVDFFKKLNLQVKTERGQRVFPASDHSSDVIRALQKRLEVLGVEVELHTRVIRILSDQSDDGKNKISGVIVMSNDKETRVNTDALILATGGMSYPKTGSDGKMFDLLRKMDIKIKKPEASLVPFSCSDPVITDMQGLSLKNVSLTVLVGGKKRYSAFGEMLFTHFGISGPLVLSASSYIREEDYDKGVKAYVDLKPALTVEELDKRILRDFEESLNKNFDNSLGKLLPSRLISAVIKKTGIEPGKKVNEITRKERDRLCHTLKNFEIKIAGNRGFEEAIITRGGVDVSMIDPSTMRSKKTDGLYFAGEMIDVDALTGGFNLQIAWSTGRLAGDSIREVSYE